MLLDDEDGLQNKMAENVLWKVSIARNLRIRDSIGELRY